MTTTRKTLGSRWTAARDAHREHQAVRAFQKKVESELESYNTSAELRDLEEMIERSGSPEAAAYGEVIQRKILRAA